MNFQLHRISKVEEIDVNKFLGDCAARGGGGGGGGGGGHREIDSPSTIINKIRSKHMKYDDETFERKFQFRFLFRAFQTFLRHHNKNASNSYDINNNKNKLILPNISPFNSSQNDSQSNRRSFFGLKNISQPLLSKSNSTINEFPTNQNYYYNQTIDNTNSKNLIEKSNSTKFSQSNSKVITGNIIEYSKSLNKKVSSDAKIKINKKKYLESVNDYRIKNRKAKNTFNLQLNKLKNVKLPKSKQEEYFKEFEIKFNPGRLFHLLKKEFNFFKIEKEDKNLRFLYEKNKNYEDEFIKKRNIDVDESKNNKEKFKKITSNNDFIKPSKRIIQNMIRKNRVIEIDEKSNALLSI